MFPGGRCAVELAPRELLAVQRGSGFGDPVLAEGARFADEDVLRGEENVIVAWVVAPLEVGVIGE